MPPAAELISANNLIKSMAKHSEALGLRRCFHMVLKGPASPACAKNNSAAFSVSDHSSAFRAQSDSLKDRHKPSTVVPRLTKTIAAVLQLMGDHHVSCMMNNSAPWCPYCACSGSRFSSCPSKCWQPEATVPHTIAHPAAASLMIFCSQCYLLG